MPVEIGKFLSIVILATLPFLLTLNGDFVFDDSEAVVKNKDVTSNSWIEPFYNDFWGTDMKSNLSHKSYRPLTILSFKINYWFRQTLLPFHFKIINLLCHIITCLLLWPVYRTILQPNTKKNISKKKESIHKENSKWWKDTAYLSTLLFAVHPVHVEAVAGIVGRADLLAAITFLLAFLCYKKAMTCNRFWLLYLLLTVKFSGISMLCKENGITVLGFCLVYEFLNNLNMKNKVPNNKRQVVDERKYHINISKSTVFRTVTIIISIICLLYARWKVMGGMMPHFSPTENPTAFATDLFSKIATYNYIYFLNLLIMIWPQWLCYDWTMGCVQMIESFFDKRILLITLMYLYGILLLRIIFSRNCPSFSRKLTLAVALIVIPFLPAANIFFPVGFLIAERVLYIPSAGYCLLVMIGYKKLLTRQSLVVSKGGVFMLLVLLTMFSIRSWQRAMEWQNEYYLYNSGLSVCPSSAKVHYNVAKVADENHQTTLALSEYREAIRLYPEYYQAMNNLANILKHQNQFDEAEHYLRAAIKHKRNFPTAWMNLGIVLASTWRFNESEMAYKTAISYRNNYPDCFYNLGNLYLAMNRTDYAAKNWLEAVNLNPKHVLAWTNLLALIDNTERIDTALILIPEVLKELPESPSINFGIANIYGKINRYAEAEIHFKKAIRLFDKDVQAIHYGNLAILYHRWNKYSLAEEMYTKALKINPKFKTAQKNLDRLRKIKS